MTGRLNGKVCLITGTRGAINSASAQTFAREGAKVGGCDIALDLLRLHSGRFEKQAAR